MPRYSYERLSAQDNAFLLWETPNLPMHTSALQIFDAGPLATQSGGVDFDSICEHFESKLHLMPRYRQKLMWIPGSDRAVWVDDPEFALDYHVRHTALPLPGSDAQLERLASRVMEQSLDRSRPLWETWVVEGLAGNRFALISKQHHCLMDGSSGADLMTSLMSFKRVDKPLPAARFLPRPLPTPGELLAGEVTRRLQAPFDIARRAWEFTRDSDDLVSEVVDSSRSLRDLFSAYANPVSETPINGPVGPHRLFATHELPLDLLMRVRRSLRCSVNDVVLTIVAGALREFMIERGVRCDDLDFRVSTPVDVRRPDEVGSYGNRVSSWIVRLPLAEPDPVRQLEAIREATRELKGTHQAEAVELLTEIADWLPIDVPEGASRSTNCIVTNVRGPRDPLYMLGAEQLAVYPQPPLMANQGLAIGVLSYNGTLCWGLNADAGRVPDIASLVEAIGRAARNLAESAGVEFAPDRSAKAAHDASVAAGPVAAERVAAEPVREVAATRDPEPPQLEPLLATEARCDPGAPPSAVRTSILAQHRAIRSLLGSVDQQAERVLRGAHEAAEPLREAARGLHEQLVAHLDFEDAHLVPCVREIDAWGEERARAIEEDHREQRAILDFFLERLDAREVPSNLLAEQLRGFVNLLREDMADEEGRVLSENLLRDDVVSIHVEAG